MLESSLVLLKKQLIHPKTGWISQSINPEARTQKLDFQTSLKHE